MAAAATTILSTKIFPPVLSCIELWRPRLSSVLPQAFGDVQVVSLVAPAGFGKTTLIASLLAHGRTHQRAVWLNLDSVDNNIQRFMSYLQAAFARAEVGGDFWQQSQQEQSMQKDYIAALDVLMQNLEMATLKAATLKPALNTVCNSAQNSAADFIINTKINPKDNLKINPKQSPKPKDTACVLLVLDNVHMLTLGSEAHEALLYLLAHLPKSLSCVLIGRRPLNLGLSKLLLEGKLLQLTEQELAFTALETNEYLACAGMSLSVAQLEHIYKLTRGWPAALRLIVASVQASITPSVHASVQASTTPSVHASVQASTKSSNHVSNHVSPLALTVTSTDVSAESTNDPFEQNSNNLALSQVALKAITSYLLDEVFSQLSKDKKQFCLYAAQVELFNPALASALTGFSLEQSAKMLSEIRDDHLFIEDVEKCGTEPWYRFYPLVAVALRNHALRCPSLDVTESLRRASVWFSQNGNPNQAAHCAMQVSDWDQLENLILNHWRSLYMQDRTHLLYQWGRALPDEVLLAKPQICAILSLPAMLTDEREFAMLCDQTSVAHHISPSQPFYAEAWGIHAHICHFSQNYDAARAAADVALKYLKPDDYFMRSSVSQTSVLASNAPDWLTYRNTMYNYLTPTLAHGNRGYICNHYAFLAFAEAVLGSFTAALSYAAKAQYPVVASKSPYRATDMNLYYARMNAAWHRGYIGEAQLNQRKYQQTTKEAFASRETALSEVYAALFSFLFGEKDAAASRIAHIAHKVPYAFFMVHLPFDMLRRLNENGALYLEEFLKTNKAVFGQRACWRRLRFASAYISGNLKLLPKLRILVSEIAPECRLDRVHSHLLLALYEELAGITAECEQAILKALNEASSEHITQIFCQDHQLVLPLLERLSAKGLLDDFGKEVLLRVAQTVNYKTEYAEGLQNVSLTARESDVVYLLVSGYSPSNIAKRLCISVATVRKHVTNVYSKLGVHSHTQLLLHYQNATGSSA
ncbi:MAG: LuxR C-terminal-related transcriptional regulator [Coriobacteriales bacterium]|jgi:ATP/maltotriose-dependent transcriptional regulator MalT|nr:LuxR C-terminal-related transcriptional regulator [Coriobacteriales bacterium]